MRLRVLTSDRARLQDLEALWRHFDQSVQHPLRHWEVTFGTGAEVDSLARADISTVEGQHDALLRTQPRLLDLDHAESHLTLLHETHHIHLLTGVHSCRIDRSRALLDSHKQARSANPTDEEIAAAVRLDTALTVWNFADEVYAELNLAEAHPAIAPSRASLLAEFALRHAIPEQTDDLFSYRVLHLALKVDLALRLLAPSRHERLAERQRELDALLAQRSTPVALAARRALAALTLAHAPAQIAVALDPLFDEIMGSAKPRGLPSC